MQPSTKHLRVQAPAPVTLHVYDVGESGAVSVVNRLLRPFGTGLFHCGVEVYGWEWSFSFAQPDDHSVFEGTGVFCCPPTVCEGHKYSVSVPMGRTSASEADTLKLLQMMELDWPSVGYDLFKRNCHHFCAEFCLRLGVGRIPKWISTMADAGAAVEDAAETHCCKAATCFAEDKGQDRPKFQELIVADSVRQARPYYPNADH
uniref:PPPDE domain-containing protein n=1 Tax=Zooxanthella nutricula TaxID=1333877 RepID=A0A7S2KS12_9DINO